MDYSKGRWQ